MDAGLTNSFNAMGAFWQKPKGALFLSPKQATDWASGWLRRVQTL
jgi:hypothetical protein